MRTLLVTALLAACDAGKVDLAAGDDTGGEGGGGTTDDGYVEGESPVIEAVDQADCGADHNGLEIWAVALSVSDPQGPDDVDTAMVSVLDGETVLASYQLACYGGACSTTWLATEDDIDCATGEASTLRFIATDRAGNKSRAVLHEP